jgi:hypothetical protein
MRDIRFNLVMNRQERQLLKTVAAATGRSEGDAVRWLVAQAARGLCGSSSHTPPKEQTSVKPPTT